MKVSNIIEHYGHNGRILRFENLEGLYPVNRYQSLLMATNAHTEMLSYVGRTGKSPAELRVVEICCGGGPAAIVLKDAGVGYVEASDINSLSVEACQRNSTLNGLTLDRVLQRDMLGTSRPMAERFDIIVCNPPCGRSGQRAETMNQYLRTSTKDQSEMTNKHLQTAVAAGHKGIDVVLPLIASAQDHLLPGGSLIFVLTSTMSFREVTRKLDDIFQGNWRLAYHTPVAQPYLRGETAKAQNLLKLAETGEIFVWEGEDGWIWRLTWIVVATKLQNKAILPGRLWFRPYGYDITVPSFLEKLPA